MERPDSGEPADGAVGHAAACQPAVPGRTALLSRLAASNVANGTEPSEFGAAGGVSGPSADSEVFVSTAVEAPPPTLGSLAAPESGAMFAAASLAGPEAAVSPLVTGSPVAAPGEAVAVVSALGEAVAVVSPLGPAAVFSV
ncbi:hypothetical protein ACWZHB_15510 [Nocardia sp. FBN12]|uniref:hypothetical protein n=1 Tax=Nocardia sp. FBN12 TaxID=3419766 RepID=UPI003D089975